MMEGEVWGGGVLIININKTRKANGHLLCSLARVTGRMCHF